MQDRVKSSRGCKLITITGDTKKLRDTEKVAKKFERQFSKWLHKSIVNGKIIGVSVGGGFYQIFMKDGTRIESTDIKKLPDIQQMLDDLGIERKGNETVIRSHIRYVIERVFAQAKRFKRSFGLFSNSRPPDDPKASKWTCVTQYERKGKTYYMYQCGQKDFNKEKNMSWISVPRLKSGSLYVKDTTITKLNLNEKTFKYKGLLGDISLGWKTDNGLISFLTEKPRGGNFTFKGTSGPVTLVTQVEQNVPVKYIPEKSIGFDINMTREHWLTFNSDCELQDMPMPDNIAKVVDKIQELDSFLKDRVKLHSERKTNSAERRPAQSQRRSCHNWLDHEIDTYLKPIIDNAIASKSLIGIDGVKTGNTNGTFGHDHIIKRMKTLCENRGIPHYTINPAYTSQKCSKCGHTHKKNRATTDGFKCQQCGYEAVSHKNAADNIAKIAWKIYNEGKEYGGKEQR